MDTILTEKIRPVFASRPIRYAALFGSRSRGDAKFTSDYDILIDYSPKYPYSLLDLVDLKNALEEKLGKPVDVVTLNTARKKLLPLIKKEIQTIYEQR